MFSLNEIANPRIEYGVAMTKCVRVSIAVGLLASVLIVGNSGCSDPPQPSANAQYARPYDVVVDGAVDEFIGPTGPTAPDFVDSAYHQLRRPDDIPPVYDPMFIKAAAANLQDDELVIGLVVNGDARAYPLAILYNREMVNDVVGGVPVLVTWCPLCYTAMVHDRRVGETAAVFGNQGALYKGAMTWYDHDSGSVWSQPLGAAIAGPRSGSALDLIPAQLTTWDQWNIAHPGTKLLSVAQPVQPFTGQLPGDQHVVGLVIGDDAAAWPYNDVARVKVLSDVVGGIPVAIWSDVHTGAIRAADLRRADGTVAPPEEVLAAEALAPEASVAAGTGGGHRELPATIVYRSAWTTFYPQSTLRNSPAR